MAKRHGQEFWQEHVQNWVRSDLTQREYCATHGLGERAFHRWRGREKQTIAAAKANLTLVPVSVGKPETGSVVRLRSPDGWEIEMPGSSVALLIDFMKHLS
jgi:hypothetical protein